MNNTGQPIDRELVIPSDLAVARQLQKARSSSASVPSFRGSEIFAIKMAVEEALVNAIKHGNQMDPDKNVKVAPRACPGAIRRPHHRPRPRLRPPMTCPIPLPSKISNALAAGACFIRTT